MAYTIGKYYRNMLGLDLRVSDLLRDQNAATDATNIMYRQTEQGFFPVIIDPLYN